MVPFPAPPSDLQDTLTQAANESLTKFDSGCVGGPETKENEAYRTLLASNITSASDKAKTHNDQAITVGCQDTLRTSEDAIRQIFDRSDLSVTEFDDKVCLSMISLILLLII